MERDLLEDPTSLLQMRLSAMLEMAEAATMEAHGPVVTYSPKVFVPLTRLCRDVCHYCVFATSPRASGAPFLSIDEVLEIAQAGEAAGCREVLFTLGERPEARYAVARAALDAMGHATTLGYLNEAAAAVVQRTSLLPHLNPGVMTQGEMVALRPHAASMGLMLECVSERLCEPGAPHFGSPDKRPARRLETLEAAGRVRVPMTTGLLVGIGESRAERLQTLQSIADLQGRYGHIQEVIIQNFTPKRGTRMADFPPASLEEQIWTIAAARLMLGPEMSLQAPPNLRPGALAALLRAGVNDWGGVSPVTPDHVNPEAPWPSLARLRRETEAAGRVLRQRLAIGPRFAQAPESWLDAGLRERVRRAVDARGLPYEDSWRAGASAPAPMLPSARGKPRVSVSAAVARMMCGERSSAQAIAGLFEVDGADAAYVLQAADELRRDVCGEGVTYVRNRNINYTNICLHRCGFCAFSKGSTQSARGRAYRLELDEIGARASEAWSRGATEVCLQGGIHPDYDGRTYISVVEAVRRAAPEIHIHAFSPLEIMHGARTLGLPLDKYLRMLKAAGLSTLPGTAAEILDDKVRAIICPGKLTSEEWLAVMRAAHGVGLRSTSTVMFGHVDTVHHWVHHLLKIRGLQEESAGFVEFVPLPFVHMQAPMWRKGVARSGPSFREAVLMHAIARLALHPVIRNIQTSWVKMGVDGAAACLSAGANDLGGTLMDESITRAAGGLNGQELTDGTLERIADKLRRALQQRTTLYGAPMPGVPVLA